MRITLAVTAKNRDVHIWCMASDLTCVNYLRIEKQKTLVQKRIRHFFSYVCNAVHLLNTQYLRL